MLLHDQSGGRDPIELACAGIKAHCPEALHCAWTIDTRITFNDGKKCDAIVVMACTRASEEGAAGAQRGVPKGRFRTFRTEGAPEQVRKCKDFITLASVISRFSFDPTRDHDTAIRMPALARTHRGCGLLD